MSDVSRRIVVVLAVLAAVAALIFAVVESDTGTDPELTTSAVEELIPGRGDLEVRQARVGIDLAPGYTGVLVINGVEIPEDQLERVEPLNQIFFQPREGREIEAFEAGQVCVVAVYWREDGERSEGQSTQWCFDVA